MVDYDTLPTQDNQYDAGSQPEIKRGWGRAVPSNPALPSVELIEETISFGRKSSCTVRIAHPAISGVHCKLIRAEDDIVWLEDSSTNGTYLGQQKITKGNRALVSNGSEIVLLRTQDEKISYKIYLEEKQKEHHNDFDGVDAHYDVRECLGVGAFAVVHKCVHRTTGNRYAMKIIDKQKYELNHGSERANSLMDEVEILKRLNHEHIVKLYDFFDTPKYLYLILELVYGGDLFERIVQLGGRGFSEDRARNIFRQMLSACQYLHQHNIVHRDLKPENILLALPDDDTIKLSDFGLSRILGEGSFMRTLCGTPQYLAPEVLQMGEKTLNGYDKAVDVWSMGVILYILLSGCLPFSSNGNGAMLDQIVQGRYSFPAKQWKNISETSRHLVQRMLCVDPAQRITIDLILKHPWMQGLSVMPKPAAAATPASQ